LFREANEIYLRTQWQPGVADIPAPTQSFDAWFEQEDDLAGVLNKIAAEIVRLGQREQGVIYAVPGHPHVGEATVPRIKALARAAALPVTVIPAPGGLELALDALELAGGSNLQIVDALEVAGLYHPPLEPGRAVFIFNLHGQALLKQLQQTLLNAYSEALPVTLIRMAGTEAPMVSTCPLTVLATQALNGLTTLYLPENNPQSSLSSFQNTVAHLRAPAGCPWDRKQTHQTLRASLLEETFEVLEALDANDPAALMEELGDLLLHILLHAQIAVEAGEFKLEQVIDMVNRKLVRRHPHVFGTIKAAGIHQVRANWETIKQQEKAAKGQDLRNHSALDGIPPALPALAQALTVSQKAVRVGFEWPDIEGVLDKIIEEAREITEATDPAHLETEIGDLLFSVVNLARWRQIDPESALRATNARFIQRFKQMEALAMAQGQRLEELSIQEMDALWDEAKRRSNRKT
jgi:tetrapyrrole methylase family protein/MazG family protein